MMFAVCGWLISIWLTFGYSIQSLTTENIIIKLWIWNTKLKMTKKKKKNRIWARRKEMITQKRHGNRKIFSWCNKFFFINVAYKIAYCIPVMAIVQRVYGIYIFFTSIILLLSFGHWIFLFNKYRPKLRNMEWIWILKSTKQQKLHFCFSIVHFKFLSII